MWGHWGGDIKTTGGGVEVGQCRLFPGNGNGQQPQH